MLVKVVYTMIARDYQYMCSFTEPYRVFYRPGEWVKPTLPNSGLFAFDDLAIAIKNFKLRNYSLPYRGPTFWWAEGRGTRQPSKVLKDPPVKWMQMYWQFEKHRQEYLCPVGYPYEVKGGLATATVICDEIYLVEPIEPSHLILISEIDLRN